MTGFSTRVKEALKGLDMTALDEANEGFFRDADHVAYFETRLRMLALMHEDPQFRKMIIAERKGVHTPAEKLATPAIVASEALNLFHHAAECLWRLILVIETLPPCPQLSLAQFSVQDFKAGLAKWLEGSSEDRAERVGAVFGLGGGLKSDGFDTGGAVYAIERLTTAFGLQLQEEANLYNSAKHGMSVSVSNARIGFEVEKTEDDSGIELITEGYWLSYLETVQRDSGAWRWATARKVVDVDNTFRRVAMCINLTRSLLTIASAHYLKEGEAVIGLPTRDEADSVLAPPPKARLMFVDHDLPYADREAEMAMRIEGVKAPINRRATSTATEPDS